jgi:chromosome segregation ATPase
MTVDEDGIGKLHQHIQRVSDQIKDVQKGQDQLHRDHAVLRDRVDKVERDVLADRADLARHTEVADLAREHIIESILGLTGVITDLRTEFRHHAEREEVDRQSVIKQLRGTIQAIVAGVITILVAGFTLLWNTGVLAQ